MITKVNKDNKAAYTILFEQAADILCGYKSIKTYDSTLSYFYKNENKDYMSLDNIKNVNDFSNALNDYKVIYTPTGKPPVAGFNKTRGITTLEEYYSWIKDLGEIDRRYTVLPLDEPHFEIDANTRAIKIPAEFKKNGIAVQGDDLAEVVYFKIDRYFDYVDLSTTQIYIQWERPKDNFKSVSPAYVVDIESEPGKLIFGWAISELLTQNPGILKFSVRFFELVDGEDGKKKINYNFSTLTATIAIQPGINFNLTDDSIHIDDCGNRLIGRLENGIVVGNYTAAPPIFIVNLIEDDTKDIRNLDLEEVPRLKVLAYSDDAGAISYSWRGDNVDPAQPTSYEYVKVDFNTEEFDSRINYYDDQHQLYTGLSKPENNMALYKKYAILDIKTAGSYYAIAENRVTNSKETTDSVTAIYPKPNAVEIEGNLLERAYLEENASMDLEVKVKDADKSYNNFNYSWKYNNKVSQGEPDSFSTLENTEASVTINNPGYYYVDISNTRNNVTTEPSVSSNVIRVTRPAEALKVEAKKKDFLASEILTGASFVVSIDLRKNPENPESEDTYELADISDYYTIDWYKDVDGNKQPDIENHLGTSIKENTFSVLDKLPPHIEGYGGNYLAIVTNFFNAKKDENGQLEGVQSEIVQFSVRS